MNEYIARWFIVIGPILILSGSVILGVGVRNDEEPALEVPGGAMILLGAAMFLFGAFF